MEPHNRTQTTQGRVPDWPSRGYMPNHDEIRLILNIKFGLSDGLPSGIIDEQHLKDMREYIRNNPVAAGLVRNAEDWPWSSAGE